MESARLHGKLPAHRRAITKAIDRVQQAVLLEPGTWALGCSGGKDSTALIGIAIDAGWRGPVCHIEYRDDYDPEPTANARALADRFGLPFVTVAVMSEMEAIDQVGSHVWSPDQSGHDAWDAAGRLWQRTYMREVTEFQKGQGWAGLMLGMRGEESIARRSVFRRKGHTYRTASRPFMTCCPLYDWSARDVWAAILARNLPYLERYDRAECRVWERSDDAWFALEAWSKGMARKMQARNPEAWDRLVQKYPGIASLN